MLLRRMLVVVAPLFFCWLLGHVFLFLDNVFAAGGFPVYVLKGLSLGVCLALLLPCTGIKCFTNGLVPWLLGAVVLLVLLLLCQYLQNIGVISLSFITLNGQTLLMQNAVLGFVLCTVFLHRR